MVRRPPHASAMAARTRRFRIPPPRRLRRRPEPSSRETHDDLDNPHRPLGSSLELNDRRLPLCGVLVLPIKLVEIDKKLVTVAPDREAIHAACRPPLDERSVRPIFRVMLRALEAGVVLFPFEGGVLMRARERERVRESLPPRDDHRFLAID